MFSDIHDHHFGSAAAGEAGQCRSLPSGSISAPAHFQPERCATSGTKKRTGLTGRSIKSHSKWRRWPLKTNAALYDDVPRLTDQQLAQMVRLRDIRPKIPVSVRLDPSVLAWLRSKGAGHLTRINAILRNIMEAEQRIARQ